MRLSIPLPTPIAQDGGLGPSSRSITCQCCGQPLVRELATSRRLFYEIWAGKKYSGQTQAQPHGRSSDSVCRQDAEIWPQPIDILRSTSSRFRNQRPKQTGPSTCYKVHICTYSDRWKQRCKTILKCEKKTTPEHGMIPPPENAPVVLCICRWACCAQNNILRQGLP